MNKQKREQIGLFRYKVIAPLLSIEPGGGRLKRGMLELSEREWEIPYSDKTRIGLGTVEEWLYKYKRGGLEALMPAVRKDFARSRKIGDHAADEIEKILCGRPELDGPGLLKELCARKVIRGGEISLSCIYRFLRARGLDKRRQPVNNDCRAFEFEFPGDCWQCDIMYSPALPTKTGERKRTFLYAVLDDSTRIIAHAQFYFSQDLSCLKDTLKQAFMKRGVPKKLYMDNARIFRSKSLIMAAGQLGFHLIYGRPYYPLGRAKLERFFGTARRSFLARLDTDRISGLSELNRLLWAWLEGEYHVTKHRSLGETPLNKWLRLGDHIRPAPVEIDLDRVFLEKVTRKVKKDGTFTIKGKQFEAGVDYIGEKIEVHFDPFDMRKAYVKGGSLKEKAVYPLNLLSNQRIRRQPDKNEKQEIKIRLCSIEKLADKLERERFPKKE